jgi:hypothetical protein
MHYMTHGIHRIEKHKFDITCPDALFSNPYRSHVSMKISAITFHTTDAPECTT